MSVGSRAAILIGRGRTVNERRRVPAAHIRSGVLVFDPSRRSACAVEGEDAAASRGVALQCSGGQTLPLCSIGGEDPQRARELRPVSERVGVAVGSVFTSPANGCVHNWALDRTERDRAEQERRGPVLLVHGLDNRDRDRRDNDDRE